MSRYTITAETVTSRQAEHLSGGDTIVRDDIASGRLTAVYVVRRRDGPTDRGEQLSVHTTLGSAERYIERVRAAEAAS